jgi:hypothetical protein
LHCATSKAVALPCDLLSLDLGLKKVTKYQTQKNFHPPTQSLLQTYLPSLHCMTKNLELLQVVAAVEPETKKDLQLLISKE